MRRYASIDFLRGFAIFMMIALHTIQDSLDSSLINNIGTLPLISGVALILLNFMGGLAGFFLLVSAIGNMISMQRHLQAGKPVKELAVRQIVGGLILLLFACLTEGIIGYKGAIGELIRLNPNAWQLALWREYHMETIQTIAWCVIINGAVQALLSRGNAWQKPRRMMKIYAVLAVAVVAATPLIWWLISGPIAGIASPNYSGLIPGYPFAYYPGTSGRQVQYPLEGVTTPWGYFYLLLLAPLAGFPEPIFPYLAVSFLGSIVGIIMSQPREEIPRDFPKKGMFVGMAMFLVGIIFLLLDYITIMNGSGGAGAAISIYSDIWNHRAYGQFSTTYNGQTILYPAGMWLFQFLVLNGAALFATLLVVRLVEFRGKGARFAKQTTTIRRYGFVAFSVYNYQFFAFPLQLILSLIVYGTPTYQSFTWPGMLLLVVLAYLEFQAILLLWEKVNYVGSIEWCIGTIGAAIIPARKKEKAERGPKWWQKGMLDVKGSFYEPEWLNIVEVDEIPHEELKESKLAWKLSLMSFLVFPLGISAYLIGKRAIPTEQENKYNRRAMRVGIAGFIWGVFWIVVLSVVSLAMVGISL